MRADDLDHHEFLQLNPEEGIIRFGGERALLVDAVAMGLLRKNLVDSFGATAARTVLTQFGFANGWRMSEAIQSQFESPAEWANAGIRVPALGGLCRFEASSTGPLSKDGAVMVAWWLRTKLNNTCCTLGKPTIASAGRCAGCSAAS